MIDANKMEETKPLRWELMTAGLKSASAKDFVAAVGYFQVAGDLAEEAGMMRLARECREQAEHYSEFCPAR